MAGTFVFPHVRVPTLPTLSGGGSRGGGGCFLFLLATPPAAPPFDVLRFIFIFSHNKIISFRLKLRSFVHSFSNKVGGDLNKFIIFFCAPTAQKAKNIATRHFFLTKIARRWPPSNERRNYPLLQMAVITGVVSVSVLVLLRHR